MGQYKQLKVTIFDDHIDSKSIESKYGVTFTTMTNTSISKSNNGDYEMIFYISDFNKIEMDELARYILQFIIDTTRPGEKVLFQLMNEMAGCDHVTKELEIYYKQFESLRVNMGRLADKIIFPGTWFNLQLSDGSTCRVLY